MTKLLRCALLVFVSVSSVWAQYNNPVIPGDRPDPTVIRVGGEYWATTTSGTWEPEFSIFHSRDLLHWGVAGAVFQKRPAWAEKDFWAPEISTHGGRFFVYYTARNKGGRLCVAVATASAVSGPYTDHGPLVCQNVGSDVGSIDAMAVTDDRTGARYLVWKVDGNDARPPEPTPILAQRLSPDGLKLVGEIVELIRNDPKKKWESRIVEGAFILRRGDWFYLFYSGNACCGGDCDYALGVARSRSLLGPYEKHPDNPILEKNDTWKCPGHGSIVTDTQGRDFLLYHAYRNSKSAVFIGREALLDQISWSSNGWPTVNEGRGPSETADKSVDSWSDDFAGSKLKTIWQWPQFERPSIKVDAEGWLILSPTREHANDELGAVLSQPVTTDSFVATTLVDTTLMNRRSVGGLSVYQNRDHAVGITVGRGTVSTYVLDGNQRRPRTCENAFNASRIYLRMTVTDGSKFRFAFSRDGENWKNCGDEVQALEAARIALTVGGQKGVAAKFDWLRVTP